MGTGQTFTRTDLVAMVPSISRRNDGWLIHPVVPAVRLGGCGLKQVCVCYTSDLQTSSIFTVDYFKGVAQKAAEAGAHMIGIKVREYPRMKQAVPS